MTFWCRRHEIRPYDTPSICFVRHKSRSHDNLFCVSCKHALIHFSDGHLRSYSQCTYKCRFVHTSRRKNVSEVDTKRCVLNYSVFSNLCGEKCLPLISKHSVAIWQQKTRLIYFRDDCFLALNTN
jgi:hypothetical protein